MTLPLRSALSAPSGTENRGFPVDRLQGRYSNAQTTTLRARIEKGSSNPVRLEVE